MTTAHVAAVAVDGTSYVKQMKTINLFGEDDGIAVLLDDNGDVVQSANEASVRVIGHHLYCCSLNEARERIAEQGRERKLGS